MQKCTKLKMTPEMEAEIMSDKAHYKQALRRIERKHTETNGAFCNGYFTKVAKEYHVKVRPLKALYEIVKEREQ